MKVLFMGDSITDMGRNLNNGSHISIGQGYALIVAAQLSYRYPERFTFINNGISGNRIVDLYARIKADAWNHAPDVLSILVGVNDVFHEIGNGNGVDAERFETVYRMYISDTKKRFPKMKMILMEPFVVNAGNAAEHWQIARPETELRATATKKIADDEGLYFLPLQERFDKVCETVNPSYWSDDGVHPSLAGHQLIAEAWLKLFESHIL